MRAPEALCSAKVRHSNVDRQDHVRRRAPETQWRTLAAARPVGLRQRERGDSQDGAFERAGDGARVDHVLAGIATEILLITLIVYTPWGHALFGTASIALVVWLFIIPFALGMLALEELRKWLVRACPNRPTTTLI